MLSRLSHQSASRIAKLGLAIIITMSDQMLEDFRTIYRRMSRTLDAVGFRCAYTLPPIN